MPNVLLEAMACGLPVLATRCPTGPDEIITSGVDGQLCENDATSIANAIFKLYGERDRMEQFSRAASERIKQFDLANIMQQYQTFFKSKCEPNGDVQE
jgi:glycosyltransferase involved in cell wall biosynthesis